MKPKYRFNSKPIKWIHPNVNKIWIIKKGHTQGYSGGNSQGPWVWDEGNGCQDCEVWSQKPHDLRYKLNPYYEIVFHYEYY